MVESFIYQRATITKIVKAFESMRQVCSSSLSVKGIYSGRKCGWPFSQERPRWN